MLTLSDMRSRDMNIDSTYNFNSFYRYAEIRHVLGTRDTSKSIQSLENIPNGFYSLDMYNVYIYMVSVVSNHTLLNLKLRKIGMRVIPLS